MNMLMKTVLHLKCSLQLDAHVCLTAAAPGADVARAHHHSLCGFGCLKWWEL